MLKTGLLAALAFCMGLGATPSLDGAPGGGTRLVMASASADAINVDRRVARRTARRTAYRTSLPGGCVRRNAYWYCGGVYYQPVVQNGATVYVVVNL